MHDGGEVVVGEHHGRGFLGDLGAGEAHRHPNVRLLQRRRVVDAVAGHGDHVALVLERAHDPDLMFRRDAGEDGDALDAFVEFRVRQRVDLGAAQDLARQPQLARDGGGGEHVVAGDHLHLDAGPAAEFDGVLGLRPRRIDDPHKGDEREVRHMRRHVAGGIEAGRRNLRFRQRQHAHGLAGERLVLGGDGIARRVGERLGPGPGQLPGTKRQQHVRRALDADAHLVAGMMESGHELAFGIERHLGDAGLGAPGVIRIDAALGGQRQQRAFGRLADQLARTDAALVGERRGPGEG